MKNCVGFKICVFFKQLLVQVFSISFSSLKCGCNEIDQIIGFWKNSSQDTRMLSLVPNTPELCQTNRNIGLNLKIIKILKKEKANIHITSKFNNTRIIVKTSSKVSFKSICNKGLLKLQSILIWQNIMIYLVLKKMIGHSANQNKIHD